MKPAELAAVLALAGLVVLVMRQRQAPARVSGGAPMPITETALDDDVSAFRKPGTPGKAPAVFTKGDASK